MFTTDIRCGQCNKKLAAGQVIDLTIKCPRCGIFNRFTHQSATSRQNPERPERQTA